MNNSTTSHKVEQVRTDRRRKLIVNHEGKEKTIYVRDLLFVERDSRKCVGFAAFGSSDTQKIERVCINLKLRDLQEKYREFMTVNEGTLVNLAHIAGIVDEQVFLKNGGSCYVSRSRKNPTSETIRAMFTKGQLAYLRT